MNRSNNTAVSPDSGSTTDDRLHSAPAFLDLADSAARLGSNIPDISAKVELKRLEHERQRAMQRKIFEDQMRVLEHQQAQELLSLPYDPNAPLGKDSLQHIAVSAPTTPPRVNADLNGDIQTMIPSGRASQLMDAESISKAVGVANKRKSVTYAPSVNLSPDPSGGVTSSFIRAAGAKSMPASRRTSASSNDEEIAAHLHGLSLIGERPNRTSPAPVPITASILSHGSSRFGNEEGALYTAPYNAGMMLDEQLDQEMHNAMLNLPTSDEDKFSGYQKVSTSSAALDLAHISQNSPRISMASRTGESREKSSEWPQFNGSARVSDRRVVTGPGLGLAQNDHSTKVGGTVSASATPLVPQHPQNYSRNQASRRSSPPGLLENLNATRSVPATPLGMPTSVLKTPGTPQVSDTPSINGRRSFGTDATLNVSDLQASLSRLPSSVQYENASLGLGSLPSDLDDGIQPYSVDSVYGLNNNLDQMNYQTYGYNNAGSRQPPPGNTRGSTALYHHNGSRYGLGQPGRTNTASSDGKMNGLHGPKHKRGDVDREFNRYAGTRLEDLQGDIPALCKDQHGCRYLQKKLEEGVPEHRDMIFKETFAHFTELMTDPFGNYLCQKLLEYSTDDQRNALCESVAQDLVNISLNMHGTRAVQKMIDFLSSRRQQNDVRCSAQIRSIIMALSLHVVVLIKDLNGNHVIQKCLNKLAPEDNQFIYNAVAANCVEVATHRHGCCVLQRCIDHASDHQRVQLVNEITYNALTLVQDPYGNYVVQYILDLNDSRFSDGVIRQFAGNVCALSVQKFSSNVIEKCIRVAETSTRKMLIDELLNRTRLEKLLRDSYGNYCVQTALDYADPTQRAMLVDGIRPILPLIRNTPYGKRIQNKLQREQLDGYGGGFGNPQALTGMALNNQGMAMSHGHALHQGNLLPELYGSQNGLYSLPQGQPTFNQTTMHAMQPQSIESYVLQGGSQGISPSHSIGSNFAGGYFPPSMHGPMNDTYQRQAFGYGL